MAGTVFGDSDRVCTLPMACAVEVMARAFRRKTEGHLVAPPLLATDSPAQLDVYPDPFFLDGHEACAHILDLADLVAGEPPPRPLDAIFRANPEAES